MTTSGLRSALALATPRRLRILALAAAYAALISYLPEHVPFWVALALAAIGACGLAPPVADEVVEFAQRKQFERVCVTGELLEQPDDLAELLEHQARDDGVRLL